MAYADTTQANRNALSTAVRKLSTALQPTVNGVNLRGVRNDFTDAQLNAAVQAVANAAKACGYTAV